MPFFVRFTAITASLYVGLLIACGNIGCTGTTSKDISVIQAMSENPLQLNMGLLRHPGRVCYVSFCSTAASTDRKTHLHSTAGIISAC